MRQRGFTLIELICIIVILGSLGMIVGPRYYDLSDAASQAAVGELGHSFATAVQFVHMRYSLNGSTGAVDNVAGYGAGNVDTNANGYPVDTANANTIPNNLTGATRCRNVFGGILAGAPPICGGNLACNSSHDFQATTAAAQICRFTYIEDTTPARFFDYNATSGTVSITNP